MDIILYLLLENRRVFLILNILNYPKKFQKQL